MVLICFAVPVDDCTQLPGLLSLRILQNPKKSHSLFFIFKDMNFFPSFTHGGVFTYVLGFVLNEYSWSRICRTFVDRYYIRTLAHVLSFPQVTAKWIDTTLRIFYCNRNRCPFSALPCSCLKFQTGFIHVCCDTLLVTLRTECSPVFHSHCLAWKDTIFIDLIKLMVSSHELLYIPSDQDISRDGYSNRIIG